MKSHHNQACYSRKGFVVPLIIAIIALLAVGGYAYEKQKAAKQPTETAITEPIVPQVTASTDTQATTNNQMSLKDLLTLSSPQECTTTFTANGVETHGTVKVAQGKVRADYETTVSGKVWKVHALLDGSNSYTWMDGFPQGFKVALSTDEVKTNTESAQGADVNQKMNVECRSWNIEDALLSLPANINFMTIGGAGTTSGVPVPSGVTNVNIKSY